MVFKQKQQALKKAKRIRINFLILGSSQQLLGFRTQQYSFSFSLGNNPLSIVSNYCASAILTESNEHLTIIRALGSI